MTGYSGFRKFRSRVFPYRTDQSLSTVPLHVSKRLEMETQKGAISDLISAAQEIFLAAN